MVSSKTIVIAVTLLASAAAVSQAQQDAVAVARAMVIGQAYVSGNVYVAGFVEDEPRAWPRRITGIPLQEGRTERINADLFRVVVQDSEEHYYFPQREGDPADEDLFSTIDNAAVSDRNVARYRAPTAVDTSVSFFGWDARLNLADVSFKVAGQVRPVTAAERKEITARKAETPKDIDCTTVPQYLDDARVLLTANVGGTTQSIRLSKYTTPGCAGHLADIYVLDVITPGQELRRFEFLHYRGVM